MRLNPTPSLSALAAVAIVLGAASAAQAQQASLRFFPKSEIQGDVIRVDDVARIQGISDPQLKEQVRRIELGRAPEPSQERVMSQLSIKSALKQGGLPDHVKVTFPRKMVVTRPGQKVSRADAGRHIQKAIEVWVLANTPGEHKARVEPVTWRTDLMLPRGELTWKASARDSSRLSGTVMFTVQIEVGGQVIETRHVSAKLKLVGPVCVARSDLRSGDVITEGDVVEEHSEVTSSSVPCSEAIGMSVRSTLRAGAALRDSSLKAPDVIKRGDRVVIEYSSGALRVTAVGEAKKDGARGEWIQVRNTMSDSLLKARVLGAGRVMVQ